MGNRIIGPESATEWLPKANRLGVFLHLHMELAGA